VAPARAGLLTRSGVAACSALAVLALLGSLLPPLRAQAITPQAAPLAPGQAAPAANAQTQTPAPKPPPAPAPAGANAGPPGPQNVPPTNTTGQYIFRTNVREVLLHITVLDKKGRSIPGLTQSDFTIYENNVPQKINYFAHEDAPVSMGILIDNSGSMRDKRPEVNKAALNFVRAGNPQDETFIVNFNDEYYLDADFTNNIGKLQEGLDKIESRGGTALYDAIIASLDELNRYAHNDKRVLLVVTDGADNTSRYTLEETVRALQAEKGPIIYCIGLQSPDDSHSERRRSEHALKEIASATGGVAYMPKDLTQVDAITREVAADIRQQYTITYHSSLHTPGFRAINVVVKAPHEKGLVARTRPGYWPAGNPGGNVTAAGDPQ
jgi:Ca-activated chloride channel family protein